MTAQTIREPPPHYAMHRPPQLNLETNFGLERGKENSLSDVKQVTSKRVM